MANSVPAVFIIKGSKDDCWDVGEYIMANQRFGEIYENTEFARGNYNYMRVTGDCSWGIDFDVIKNATVKWPCEIEAVGWNEAYIEIEHYRYFTGNQILGRQYSCEFLLDDVDEEASEKDEEEEPLWDLFSEPELLAGLITLGTDNEEPVELTNKQITDFYESLKEKSEEEHGNSFAGTANKTDQNFSTVILFYGTEWWRRQAIDYMVDEWRCIDGGHIFDKFSYYQCDSGKSYLNDEFLETVELCVKHSKANALIIETNPDRIKDYKSRTLDSRKIKVLSPDDIGITIDKLKTISVEDLVEIIKKGEHDFIFSRFTTPYSAEDFDVSEREYRKMSLDDVAEAIVKKREELQKKDNHAATEGAGS